MSTEDHTQKPGTAFDYKAAGFINANEQWIDRLEEGDEFEVVIRARATTNGNFTSAQTIFWRDLGTNFFDRLDGE